MIQRHPDARRPRSLPSLRPTRPAASDHAFRPAQRVLSTSAGTATSTDDRVWVPPRFEVIALDCEITAYAPDGSDPLF